mgnify:CR=1 FL=1
MKDLVQCTVSRDDFQRWLYWGKTPLTIYKGEEAVTMLLKIEGLEIFLRVGIVPPFPTGEGDPPDSRAFVQYVVCDRTHQHA